MHSSGEDLSKGREREERISWEAIQPTPVLLALVKQSVLKWIDTLTTFQTDRQTDTDKTDVQTDTDKTDVQTDTHTYVHARRAEEKACRRTYVSEGRMKKY